MPTPKELEEQFWKSLKSDRTMMLGLPDLEHGHARPMTANLDGDRGPIWIFTSTDNSLAGHVADQGMKATATFASKGHDLFATVHGELLLDNDRAVIDRLWNRFIAAWYEHGKDDPKLALLRFDANDAEIWQDESSFLAGIKLLFGADPKKEYEDKVADVKLS